MRTRGTDFVQEIGFSMHGKQHRDMIWYLLVDVKQIYTLTFTDDVTLIVNNLVS